MVASWVLINLSRLSRSFPCWWFRASFDFSASVVECMEGRGAQLGSEFLLVKLFVSFFQVTVFCETSGLQLMASTMSTAVS